MAAKRGRKPGTPKTGGRAPGTPNKTTAAVKAALLEALELSHEEGSVGYFVHLAKNHPSVFGPIVSKLIPNEVVGDVNLVHTLRIVDLSDQSRSTPR